MKNLTATVLGLAMLLCAAPTIFAQKIRVALSSFDFPGSTNTQATAITRSGEVVGRYFSADGKQHGFTLLHNAFTAVDVPGATFTDVTWINDHGDIVGSYGDSRGGHAYILSEGTFRTIDFPSVNPINTLGFGISNAGDVVGVEFVDNDFNHGHGYLFSKNVFTLIDVPGAVGTFPTMVINPTRIVGSFFGSDSTYHGFALSNGQFRTIDVPDSTLTWITGVSPEGDMVGFYNSQNGNLHGFVLREDRFISIDLTGAISTEGNGINLQGDVVGRYITPDGNTHGYFLRCASCTARNADD
jgi:hypothetical protein